MCHLAQYPSWKAKKNEENILQLLELHTTPKCVFNDLIYD